MQRLKLVSSQSITRPANTTAYAANEAVAADNASVANSAFKFKMPYAAQMIGVVGGHLRKSSNTTLTNPAFAVDIVSRAPTVFTADNAALTTRRFQQADDWVGRLTATANLLSVHGAFGFLVPVTGAGMVVALEPAEFDADGAAVFYALPVATGAYAPASGEVFDCVLDVVTMSR